MRYIHFSLSLLFLLLTGFFHVLQAEAPPAADLLPENTLLTLDIPRPAPIINFLAGSSVEKMLASSPQYQQFRKGPDFQKMKQGITFLELKMGTDWKTGLAGLTRNGLTVAVTSDGALLVVADADDAALLKKLNQTLLEVTTDDPDKKVTEEPAPPLSYKKFSIWSLNNEEAHTIQGNRLIMSNKMAALKSALDRSAGSGTAALATSPAYKEASTAWSPDSLATVFVNTKLVKQNPDVMRGLEEAKNPMGSLFISVVTETLRNGTYLAAELSAGSDTLTVRMTGDGAPDAESGRTAFSIPKQSDEGVLANLQVPGMIAAASLYRDLYDFYSNKDTLFPERTSSLIFFENMMGIFFSGRDMTDEIFGEIAPRMRLVLAEQAFSPEKGIPRLQLPAFAFIFKMHHPDKFSIVMEEAWQKAIGLINFTRGQQALAGLIIDKPDHKGTKFTTAYFSGSGSEDKTDLPIDFNFRPSLAYTGPWLILSSTDSLTRDLIDALKENKTTPCVPKASSNSLVEINGAALRSILSANYESMIQQNMIDKGNMRQQAETEITTLLQLLGFFKGAEMELGAAGKTTEMRLELKVDLP